MGVNMVGVPTVTTGGHPAGRRRGRLPLRGDHLPRQQRPPNTTYPCPDPRSRPGPRRRPSTVPTAATVRGGRPDPLRHLPGRHGDGHLRGLGRGREARRGHHAELHVPRLPVHRDHGPAPYDGAPLENVQGIVLSSIDLPEGTYEATTSDDNHTGDWPTSSSNAQRSQVGNFFSLPTDARSATSGWAGPVTCRPTPVRDVQLPGHPGVPASVDGRAARRPGRQRRHRRHRPDHQPDR